MYHFSDSDSVDSDEGIRYKTDSIRNKTRISKSDKDLNKKINNSNTKNKGSRSPKSTKYDKYIREDSKGHEKKRNFEKRKDHKQNLNLDKNKRREKHSRKNESGRNFTSSSSKDQISTLNRSSLPKECVEIATEPSTKKDLACNKEHISFGPALPPKLMKKSDEQFANNDKSLDSYVSSNFMTVAQDGKDQKMEKKIIGPTLPPSLIKLPISTNSTKSKITSTINDEYQVELNQLKIESLPQHFVAVSTLEDDDEEDVLIGPVGPQSLLSNRKSDLKMEYKNVVGPTLPPQLLNTEMNNESKPICEIDEIKIIGPALPPHLQIFSNNSPHSNDILQKDSNDEIYGPVYDILQKESNDEVYGPIPVGNNYSRAHIELEERALQIKMDQLEPSNTTQPRREEWMLELPAAKAANFGMGPRQFKAKSGPDLSDRSSWTDTPEEKAKKKSRKVESKIDLQKEADLREIKRRDQEQMEIVKRSKKNRDESLLDMHTKKLKKHKAECNGPSERRPFSRDIDLQVNRFDEAQKKAVLKKAQLLDNRFSAGQSKFL